MTPSDPLMRAEYEAFVRLYEVRHSELRLEIKDLESGLKTDVSAMNVKLDGLSTQMARRGVDTWKLIATSTVSGIVGYLLYYGQHMLVR